MMQRQILYSVERSDEILNIPFGLQMIHLTSRRDDTLDGLETLSVISHDLKVVLDSYKHKGSI